MKELHDKLHQYEGEKIEYKSCKGGLAKSIWETVSAFSNSGDGLILLGYEKVKDKYMPVGLDNADKLQNDFTSLVSEKFNFCPIVMTAIENDKGKPVILIEVKEAPKYQKPIYLKDAGPIKGGFKRIGGSDVRLTDPDIHRFYLERTGAPDAQPVEYCSMSDVDPGTIEAYRNLRKLKKPDAPELKYNDKELLASYNLLISKNDKLTIAGLLLFGEEEIIKKHFPALRLDIIRIKGTEWGKDKDPFLSKDLIGNLFNLRAFTRDFLDRFFLVPFHMDNWGDRVEENAHRYALRESLTNLLMHQNYFHRSPAQIRIYNDRIEFYNPGYSLKDPKFFNYPGSELRNPLIASVFYDIGWAEAKGTGLKDITESLETEGYPLPEYLNDERNDTFTLILRHPFVAVTPQVAPEVTEQVTEQDTEQVTEQVVNMMDRRAITLEFCKEPKSLKEIMKFLGLKHRPTFLENILNPVLKTNLLQRTIPEKPRSRFQKYISIKKDVR
ncbi:putative DNA binding domain-containing protein [candidate division WOR-3 bacterium]|nr:putative DNA binding domain-containing protein [candidate division WOR-3 bacterium]